MSGLNKGGDVAPMKQLNSNAFNKWIYEIIDDYTHRLEVYKGGA